jgi:polyphosphate kinase
MGRNLFRRVETAFPIEDPELKTRVLDESLSTYFEDNVSAWELRSDGSYRRLSPGEQTEFRAQDRLLARLTDTAAAGE